MSVLPCKKEQDQYCICSFIMPTRKKERERILLCRSVFRQVFVVVKRNRRDRWACNLWFASISFKCGWQRKTVIKLEGTRPPFERCISFWYQSKHNQATFTRALRATINDTRLYLSRDMKDSQDEVSLLSASRATRVPPSTFCLSNILRKAPRAST